MQNKGFISVIAVLLVLICGFYISFSFVTSHYEKQAEEYAQRMSKTNDVTNDAYKKSLKQFNDSLDKEKVYLGYTYKQVRQMEIGLGLDLKGGMNVVLEISVPDILLQQASGENQRKELEAAIKKVNATGANGSDKDYISKVAAQFQEGTFGGMFKREGELKDLKSNASNKEVVAALEKHTEGQIDAAYNIFRTRIDQFGVVSPNIQKLQDKRGQILLELPGIKEPERVTELLKSSANLEFYKMFTLGEIGNELAHVAQEFEAQDTINKVNLATLINFSSEDTPLIGRVAAKDMQMVDSILQWGADNRLINADFRAVYSVKPTLIPEYDKNGKIMMKDGSVRDPKNFDFDAEEGKYRAKELYDLLALRGESVLDGSVINGANYETDKFKGTVVNMSMNDEGAKKWATITGQNKGKCIAIVLDDKVYSYPRVNGEITGGRSEITGNFTVEEANDLSNVLKSGRMNAKINVVSSSVIGPSLGATAVQQGFMSFIVAIALLMVFMIAIYGVVPGLVANVGLILNLYFTLGILASLQAVLTLSGIAGIVLALGMAVDANVLIFERTKEELKAGKGLRQAISEGYSNAFSAIFDSNLTSVITGVILLIFGSGPIKGFATTLIIGLVCSFFTAIFLTRIAFELITKNGRCAKMSFTTPLSRNLFNNTKINFLGKWKVAATIWIALIVISIGSLVVRGMNQGIDFSGGRNYVVKFDKDVDPQSIQKRLMDKLEPLDSKVSVGVITIDDNKKVRISTNYKIDSNEDEVVDKEMTHTFYEVLQPELTGKDGKVLTENDFSVADEDHGIISIQKVGPSVADDMRRGAIWAVSIAVICMFLYILLRFRNIAFSIGAVAAVALTAFLIIGFYSVCWGFLPFSMEIDQSFIAAVLTIIGYQINDTVVVFDRVREMIKIYPKEDRYITFNKSLNTTLGRTLMTSLSTLLVLLCIFFLGGDTIRSFTFAMIFGVIVGTFCSLFCAAPIAYQVMKRVGKKKAAAEEVRLQGNRRFK